MLEGRSRQPCRNKRVSLHHGHSRNKRPATAANHSAAKGHLQLLTYLHFLYMHSTPKPRQSLQIGITRSHSTVIFMLFGQWEGGRRPPERNSEIKPVTEARRYRQMRRMRLFVKGQAHGSIYARYHHIETPEASQSDVPSLELSCRNTCHILRLISQAECVFSLSFRAMWWALPAHTCNRSSRTFNGTASRCFVVFVPTSWPSFSPEKVGRWKVTATKKRPSEKWHMSRDVVSRKLPNWRPINCEVDMYGLWGSYKYASSTTGPGVIVPVQGGLQCIYCARRTDITRNVHYK